MHESYNLEEAWMGEVGFKLLGEGTVQEEYPEEVWCATSSI